MSDTFNTQLNLQASGKFEAHFARRAEVIIIKTAKLLPDAGYTGDGQAVEAANKFSEFLKSGVMRESLSLEGRDPNPDIPSDPRNIYWTISTSSVGAVSKVGGTSQLLPNGDVESINTTPCANEPSRATIVIRNPLEKYSFKRNPMYLGQTVFESNDVVYINLSGLDNKLYRVFTGLVTTVTPQVRATGSGWDHTITLECDDMLKRLWECRTNIRPGFNPQESLGAALSIYTNSFADELPHDILSKIMVRTYSDFYSIPGFRSQLTTIRSKPPQQAAHAEEDLYNTYTKLPAAGPSGSPTTSPFLVTDGMLTQTGGTASSATDTLGTTESVPKEIPSRVYGFRQAPKTSGLTDVERAFSGKSPLAFGTHPMDDLAFVIEGTSQPVYDQTFASYSLASWNSEWKSSYEIVKQCAQILNFELHTTEEGVVRFRAFNNLLPADVKNSDSTRTRVGFEYWLQQNFISAETFTDTDEGIITIASVMGQYKLSNLNATGIPNLLVGRAVDPEKLSRFGARPGPQQTRLQLLTQGACEAAAAAYLYRMNARARRGTVSYLGDARLKPGNPCYVPHRNRVYYIESISHSFVAGASYTMTLNLTYGRVPVAITAEKAATLNKSIETADPVLSSLITSQYVYPIALIKRSESGLLDPSTLLLMVNSTDLDRYTKHGPAGDNQLVFNGYVWEDIPTGTFEELQSDYLTTNTIKTLAKAAQAYRTQSSSVIEEMRVTQNANLQDAQVEYANAQKDASIISKSNGANQGPS